MQDNRSGSKNKRWNSCVQGIVRWRVWGLLIAIAIGMGAYPVSRRLEVDRRLETMFPEKDSRRLDFELLRRTFGANEVVLCIASLEGIWNGREPGIKTLRALSRELATVEGVQAVMDLSKLEGLVGIAKMPSLVAGGSTLETAASENSKLELDEVDPLAAAMLDLFQGYTHARGKETVAIACMLRPDANSESRSGQGNGSQGSSEEEFRAEGRREEVGRDRTLAEMARILGRLDPPGEMIGEPVLIADGFRLIESDGWWLGVAVSGVLGGLLLVGYRSWRWTLAAIGVVQWSLVVTKAILVMSGLEVTMVSTMLSAIVTVIGVATSIHWMLGYQRALQEGLEPHEALRESLKRLIRPIVWACVTDAVGFASLMVSQVGPVRDYGLMMSIASLVVLMAILLIVPGVIGMGGGVRRLAKLPGDAWIQRTLGWSLQTSARTRGWVWGGVLGLGIWAVIGSLRLEVETNFVRNFSAERPMVRAYERVEEELGGAGVWDILLPCPAKLNGEYLESVLAFEERLRGFETRDGYRLSKVLSFADAWRAFGESPLAKFLPPEARLAAMRASVPEFTDALIESPGSPSADRKQTETSDAVNSKMRNSDPGSSDVGKKGIGASGANMRWLRIMLRSPERASAGDKQALIEMVTEETQGLGEREEWRGHFAGVVEDGRVTGHFVLLTSMVSSLIADQWRCFLVATVGIGFILWIAVGNWRWVAIALIPNTLPAMMVLGTMGWLGWKINLGAALIAAVSIGISVDSSLHYLLALRRGREEGLVDARNLDRSHHEVGMALIVSTLALLLGFGWLATSEFLPTVAFGVTASMTMLGGLIGNLWLLPLLVQTEEPAAAHR